MTDSVNAVLFVDSSQLIDSPILSLSSSPLSPSLSISLSPCPSLPSPQDFPSMCHTLSSTVSTEPWCLLVRGTPPWATRRRWSSFYPVLRWRRASIDLVSVGCSSEPGHSPNWTDRLRSQLMMSSCSFRWVIFIHVHVDNKYLIFNIFI